jgi:hypothetical protein
MSQSTAAAALPEYHPSDSDAARVSTTVPRIASGSQTTAARAATTGSRQISGAMYTGPPGKSSAKNTS